MNYLIVYLCVLVQRREEVFPQLFVVVVPISAFATYSVSLTVTPYP